MIKNKNIQNWWYLSLAIAGLVVSFYLFIPYAQDTSVELCSTGGGCDAVKNSGFSHLFGIKHWALSLPFWGIIFYSFLIIYNLCDIFSNKMKELEQTLLLKLDLIAIIGGFLFSIYLTGLEAFVITAWCSFCMIQAVIATLYFTSYIYNHLIMSIKDKILVLMQIYSFVGIIYLTWWITSQLFAPTTTLWITFSLLVLLFIFVTSHFPIFTSFAYQRIFKPILFKFDAEDVHDTAIKLGIFISKIPVLKSITSRIYGYQPRSLNQDLLDLNFTSPVGLSAGFDYNGRLTNILADIGFGFESAGTITYSAYEGNTRPRLGRLPKSKSLLVNKGFKNLGIKTVLEQNLSKIPPNFPVGISIGATNSPQTNTSTTQIADIIKSFELIKNREDFAYIELNISCPNVAGSGHLARPDTLEDILSKIEKLKIKRPLFVKFPAEIDWSEARKLVEIMISHKVTAVIVSNLVKDRADLDFDKDEINKATIGNFSGKPVQKYSDDLIKNIYREFGGQILIVGLGGIFTAQDAYKKIKLGANLVQLITGIIYGGPSTIWEINQGLDQLLKADGYNNISEAVGAEKTKS